MFSKQNAALEALNMRLVHVERACEGLLKQWEKEQIDLSDIKAQVLRTLNRIIAQERRREPAKSSENGPQLEIEEPATPNPLALGILKRRR